MSEAVRAGTPERAAWVPCPRCEDFWCRIHELHAHDCECPPIEEWPVDPYAEGGPG